MDPIFVSAVQRAITQAKTIEEVDRLELALEKYDPSLVEDLLGPSTQFAKRKSPPTNDVPPAKVPKVVPKATQGLSKLSGLNSITLSLLLDRAKHDAAFPDTANLAPAPSQGLWRSSSEAAGAGGHSSVVVEVACVLGKFPDASYAEIPARVLVLDLETEQRLLDVRLRLPEDAEVIDARGETSEAGESEISTLEKAQTELLALLKGPETFICTSNWKIPHLLRLRHSRWLPTGLIFKTSETEKKKIAGNFHVRNVVPQWHVRQTLLGESSDNWQAETLDTLAAGTARLIKFACAKFSSIKDNFLPKHHPETLWLSKIPRNADLHAVFPTGKFPTVHWHFDTHEEVWLGETAVTFASEDERNKIFDALPAIVDVYVSWERLDGGEVSEETLRQAAGNFGRVCAVRIPVRKDAEATRPFAFVSFLKPQDAAKMCAAKKIATPSGLSLHAHLAQVDKKNPVKRVPLESRVIEIYKM